MVRVKATWTCKGCNAEAEVNAQVRGDGLVMPPLPLFWTGMPAGENDDSWRGWCDRVRCHEAYVAAMKREDDRTAGVAP